ncbi:MAG: hypothetical protein DMF78_02370 [Acidobacteria bacterium]|nr:MAG: hypothetical protein DMF78_02370 [Acidobacteriota bacterium]
MTATPRPGGPSSDDARAREAGRFTVLYAVMTCLVLLVGVQWILLSIAIDGFLGGPRDLLVPAAVVSALCCAASWRLLRFAR